MQGLLVKLLVVAKVVLAKLFVKIGLLLSAVMTFVGPITDDMGRLLLSSATDDTITAQLFRAVTQKALEFFFKTPAARAAAKTMGYAIVDALHWAVIVMEWAAGVFAVLLLIIGAPLFTRAVSKRRPYIFVSFQHQREILAAGVEHALASHGFRTYRLPYRPETTHQQVVTETNTALRRCDAVVCLPGVTESYVEIEVSAATHGFKPIAFAVPSHGGTLPNSADKRYPVFRLEAIEEERYQPLGEFLHYVIGDLASGWRQVRKSARHPFVVVSWWSAVLVLCTLPLVLFIVAYGQALSATEVHVARGDSFVEARGLTVVAIAGVLAVIAAVALMVTGYTLLVVVGVWRQRRAQRRASLKAGAADFARDDWVGVIPDMGRGSKLYECLFDIAPLAHHEASRAPA